MNTPQRAIREPRALLSPTLSPVCEQSSIDKHHDCATRPGSYVRGEECTRALHLRNPLWENERSLDQGLPKKIKLKLNVKYRCPLGQFFVLIPNPASKKSETFRKVLSREAALNLWPRKMRISTTNRLPCSCSCSSVARYRSPDALLDSGIK